MRTGRLLRWGLTAWPLVATAVSAAAQAAHAQSVIPPQLTGFLCSNYNAIVGLVTVVLLVVAAAALVHGLVIKRSSLVIDLVIDGIIAITVTNLKSILGTFGLTPQGC